MNFNLILGAAAILYGLCTAYLRATAPEKLSKLEAMRQQWGQGAGTAIHVVGCLLPLCAIVASLFALNLEKAVFEIMGGFQESTASDGAYAVLFLLTILAFYAAVPLLVAYLILVRLARLDARLERAGASTPCASTP
jgi:hypothetical protein